MGLPRILVENLFSKVQFPNHTVTAEEETAGNEVEKLANGRRSSLDFWTPTTNNSDTFATVQADRVRSVDMVVLDRGHNLTGKRVRLRGSSDNFTTYDEIFSIVLPAESAPGGLNDVDGVRTEEGAWAVQFDVRAYKYWRLFVDAMGAGLKPQLIGLWAGLSYEPTHFLRPADEEADRLFVSEFVTESGWIGRNQVTRRRNGTINYKILSFNDYDQVRYHLHGHFGSGRPMWICFDQDQADRTILTIRPQGVQGFPFGTDWGYRQTQLAWLEHEPAPP